ncbi:hypothetical protein NDA18_003696 [Ustilago nuda]|nr:hypothetical protein NDA18_003696 [Ustilago nuda]
MVEQHFNSLNDKLERLLSLMEAQLELTQINQRNERLCCANLGGGESNKTSPLEDQAERDDAMEGAPPTPSPTSQPRQVVSLVESRGPSGNNYDKYASPTRPRYFKPRVDPHNWLRVESHGFDQEEDASVSGDPNLSHSKPVATPFPKFNPRDVEIFILEAEAWFKFNQVYEQARMINHMGAQLEGNACKWWTSKLRINRAQEGSLFNDWHYFTECLMEQFNPRNARMEAYNKLLALRLTSDTPGTSTHHFERFRDLEDCPSKKPDASGPRPMGPKVRVTTETPVEEEDQDPGDSQMDNLEAVDPNDLDFSPYQPPMVAGQEEAQDDVDEGNISGVMH